MTDFTRKNISCADILVLSLCRGEPFICTPELLARKKGVMIGLINGERYSKETLPVCFQEIIFVSRNAPLDDFYQIFQAARHTLQCHEENPVTHACAGCHHRALSPRQTVIMASLYQGLSTTAIAEKLKIDSKTVYAHKYDVMQKFQLDSDHDLQALLTRMREKNMQINLLRECLRA
ncbi:LuxR C-terminal-related transcriptional regulator [Leclercia adecarboxylata]|uniref:helix-turn-helix transcriptional regulator n=1 Tax=Leclercia adecarboxylata TaxID=83655 RepID=UPI002DB772BB|nr:LuxR C-terminal-related transcriptional regulator [Leclercia adecarboxylata]MEB6377369.1 LuxR C-terminal-related transcriptional regulator [Leclercia adecarboxylata]